MCYNWHIKRLFQSSYLPGLIPKVTHVHEYKEGVDDFSVFDISACYIQPKQVERVVLSLPGITILLGYFLGKIHTLQLLSISVWTYASIHTSTHACMYACIYVDMLFVGCRLLLRHNADQTETTRDCVATIYISRDWRRLDQGRRD